MIAREQDAVEAFHAKFDFAVGKELKLEPSTAVRRLLLEAATTLARLAEASESAGTDLMIAERSDDRLYRLHLMAEELGEIAEALADKNEVKLADGLGDLLYVLLGTCVVYGIPIMEIFDTIHASNMSKTRNVERGDSRMRNGKRQPGYVPPDIVGALKTGRERALQE